MVDNILISIYSLHMMIFEILLILMSVSHAQVGATTDALGGAGVAHASALDSAFLNPAGLAFFSDVQMGGSYRFGKTSLGDVRQINAVMAEATRENLFAGSLAYRQRDYETSPMSEINEKQFVANIAFLLTPQWSVGLRGYKVQTDLQSHQKIDQYNGDLGIHYVMNDYFGFALTQTGILSTKEGLVAPLGVLPETRVGTMVQVNQLVGLLADVGYAYNQNPDKRTSQSFGVVLTKMEFLKFHFGARFDDRSRERAYTAGLQFYGPRLKLGYAYQKEVRQEWGETHTIDISLNL